MKKRRKSPRSRWGSVFVRGSTYYIKFRWPRGGRYYTRAVGPEQADAERTLVAVEAALKNGVPLRQVLAEFFGFGSARTKTFREAADAYLLDARRRKKPKTMAGEVPRLKLLCKAAWAGLPLAEITSLDLQTWLNRLQDKKNLKGGSVNRYRSQISAVFRWAAKHDLCSRQFNPALEVEQLPESSGREVYLSPSELEAWIDAAPAEFRVLALFYARTGVRRDEARLLRWRAIDLARGMVKIEAEASKNHISREIELTPDLQAALHDLHSRETLRAGGRPAGDSLVFTIKGSEWSTNRVRSAFKVTLKNAAGTISDEKLADLRLHDIRHSVGAILATNGISLEVIAKVLGHKSLVTTRRYAHVMPSAVSRAAKVLYAAIPNNQPDRISEAG